MQDISIMYLFHLAWRRIWAIVIAACLCAAMTFAYCKFVVNPKYKAQSTIYVTNGNINPGETVEEQEETDGVKGTDVSASVSLSFTVVDILKQPDIYREMVNTIEKYNDKNYRLLKNKISVSRSEEERSMLIYISATSTDKNEAIDLANDFAALCQTFIPNNVDKNIRVSTTNADSTSVVYPRTVMSTAIAFLVGAVLAFAISFIIDISDQSIRGEDEFVNQYEIPLLGSIPDFDNIVSSPNYKGYYGKASYRSRLKKHLTDSNNADDSRESVLEKKQIPFVIVESYKNIRTGVAYLLSREEKSSFTITSANAGEGKSTTAANLAVAFSQLGKTVLLVDADLRRASLHKKFKLENGKGLADVLTGTATLDEAIVTIKPGLNILTAGFIPPNPSELLDSVNFEETMKLLNEQYDYVIVDTPPLNVVTDSMIIAPQTGGVILIVRDGYTPHYSIKKVLGDMDFANINILGAVMNGSHPKNKNKYIYRKYSYGYYGSYYKYDYHKNGYNYDYTSKPESQKETGEQ